MSIPCVAGPYTNINATLRLLENKFRNTAIAKNANDYLEKTEETDERFSSFIIPISAIAASSAQNDGGMFELNFKDERYLPFEGAGVVSKWRLELPNFRQFDYETISDAVIHLRYISTEGGERLKKAASDSATAFMKKVEDLGEQEGFFGIVDLQHDVTMQWHKALQTTDTNSEHTLVIPDLKQFLPFYALGKQIEIKDVQFFHSAEVTAMTATDVSALTNFEVKFKTTRNVVSRAYLIFRFTLK